MCETMVMAAAVASHSFPLFTLTFLEHCIFVTSI